MTSPTLAVTTPSLRIDGEAVPAMTAFTWVLTAGVTAPEITLTVDPELAEKILNNGKREVEITLEAAGTPKLTIRRVVVVGEVATDTPLRRTLLLSDVRWYWQRIHLKRYYNIRQRTGDAHRVGGGPLQIQPIADEFRFAPFSVGADGQPLKAQELLRAVLDAVVGPGRWISTARARPTLVPNNVELDDSADAAIGRALAYVGGADVFVDLDGMVRVYDRVLGSEARPIADLVPYDLLDLGKLRLLPLARSRPPRIHVLYTREVELRVDFDESIATRDRTDDNPYCENVIPVTDPQLKVGDKTQVQGTYVEVRAFLDAIEKDTSQRLVGGKPLTLLEIQRRFLGPNLLLQYAVGFDAISPNQVWANRVNAILANYRTTFRLNKRFVSRIVPGTLRAVRAALLDAATGLRQPSLVYADHCQKPTLRFLTRKKDVPLGWNVNAFPGDVVNQRKVYTPPNPTIDVLKPAPATVEILDDQTGVFHVDFRLDTWDESDQIVPSLVADLPVVSPAKVATLGALATWEQARLTAEHRLTTVLSCVPVGRNDERQLHDVAVELAAALDRLAVDHRDIRAEGPDLFVRVGASLVTARFSWDDAQRDALLAAFDVGKDFPDSLKPINGKELADYSVAVAATIYAMLLDHYEGVQAVELDARLVPVGSVHTVAHQLDAQGRTLTVINADGRGAPVAPETLLSASSRRVLFQEIQP